MNKFKVTLKENKRYKPSVRVVEIGTSGGFFDVMNLINGEFGKKGIVVMSVVDQNNTEYIKSESTEQEIATK